MIAIFLVGVALLASATLLVGSEIAAPTQRLIGPPPQELHAEDVSFPSKSGSILKGWFVHPTSARGAIVLMHGIHADRTAMLSHARFLSAAGYSVLLFDFQASGESIGRHQTFGYLESLDARAACEYLRSRVPSERIGAIGLSLGGAAAVLGPDPLDVQALVLEAVYPTIEEATANRIGRRLGAPGRWLSSLLLWQLHPRLGISVADLRPIDRIGTIRAPLLLIAGGADESTTPQESRRLFEAAPEPKQYWEIKGAGHQDFHKYARQEYERRVLEFFGHYLRNEQPNIAMNLTVWPVTCLADQPARNSSKGDRQGTRPSQPAGYRGRYAHLATRRNISSP